MKERKLFGICFISTLDLHYCLKFKFEERWSSLHEIQKKKSSSNSLGKLGSMMLILDESSKIWKLASDCVSERVFFTFLRKGIPFWGIYEVQSIFSECLNFMKWMKKISMVWKTILRKFSKFFFDKRFFIFLFDILSQKNLFDFCFGHWPDSIPQIWTNLVSRELNFCLGFRIL